jgi:hypothetical protein
MSEMSDYNIEITYEQIDKIMVNQMKDTREQFLIDLETIKDGTELNVFTYNDPEQDIAEIQRHIDALTLLLSWYGIPEDV